MSFSGVNQYGMSRNRDKVTDKDIERFFAGETPNSSSLAMLRPIVDQLHAGWGRTPTPESVSAFARSAARLSASSTGAGVTQPPPIPKRRRRRLVPRLAVPLALVMLVSGLTGAAIAADGAVPGDPLYGFNLMLEKVGIGKGGAAKRFTEAAELASRGDEAGALAHAAEAIATEDPDDVATAQAVSGLEKAIDHLTSEVPGQSNEVRGRVAAMLQWMIDNAGLIHDPEAEPGAFGRGVAAMARQIGGKPDGPAEKSSEKPKNNDVGNSGELGGQSKGPPGPPAEGIPPNRP